jgi:hypothetical protein
MKWRCEDALHPKAQARQGKYWFKEHDLAEPIDWDYLDAQPHKVQVALEVY